MQMINEVTVTQQNKNIFNKVISCLKKYKDINSKDESLYHKVRVKAEYKGLDFSFFVKIRMVIDDIITVKEKDIVFFCAKIKPMVVSISLYWHDLGSISCLDFFKYFVDGTEWRDTRYAHQNLWDIIEDEGIKPGASKDEIKNANIFKEFNKKFNALPDAKIEIELDKYIQKKLTVRENIIPLLFYNIKEDEFNYPRYAGGADNPRSSRDTCSAQWLLSSDINDVCKRTMQNTPYHSWTEVEFESPYFKTGS